MAEVAPSSGGGGGGRTFLLIIAGLAAVLFIGLLALGAIVFLPGLLGGEQPVAVASTPTPTRIVIPPTATRTPPATATLVVDSQPTPVLAPGERQVLVEVDGNKNVTLTTFEGGKTPMVQKGTWSWDTTQEQLTLVFTTLNGKPFQDEIVLKFENGQLVPVSFNRVLHGDISKIEFRRTGGPSGFNNAPMGRVPGLSYPAAQATATTAPQATATPDPLLGDYGGTLPAPGPGEHLAQLALNPNGTAIFVTTEAGKSSIIQTGTWKAEDNVITVSLTEKDGAPFPDTIVFDLKGNQLVSTTLDPTVHGAALVMNRDPNSPTDANNPAAGTYTADLAAPGTATPIPITATPIAITATPQPGQNLPDTGAGENMLLLFGGGVLLLGLIVVVRRMRAT